MAQIANRRSVMMLFSNNTGLHSHMVRIVLAEKGINFEIQEVDPANTPEDLRDLNPYNEVPTLVDRDLVLFESQVIMEYLDERFPHPPLMPVDPVSRARNRLMLSRIQRDWLSQVQHIEAGGKTAEKVRKELRDSLCAVAPVFAQTPFFMSEEFSLVDCATAALLWRLPAYGIELPKQAKPLEDYAQQLFKREGFRASLSEAEREMRA